MDFLGIGGWEILLILIIALMVLGPGKIVDFARTLGKMVRAFRKATSDLTTQITRELDQQKKAQPPKQDVAKPDVAQQDVTKPDERSHKPQG